MKPCWPYKNLDAYPSKNLNAKIEVKFSPSMVENLINEVWTPWMSKFLYGNGMVAWIHGNSARRCHCGFEVFCTWVDSKNTEKGYNSTLLRCSVWLFFCSKEIYCWKFSQWFPLYLAKIMYVKNIHFPGRFVCDLKNVLHNKTIYFFHHNIWSVCGYYAAESLTFPNYSPWRTTF